MGRSKKASRIFIAFLCFIVCRGETEEGSLPFGQIGRISASDNPVFRIEMKNDSYSMLTNGDWDDLRAFGMYFGAAFGRWSLEFTADGLMNRAGSTESSGRIDMLSGILNRKILQYSGNHFSTSLAVGAGILSLGDYGFYQYQRIVHDIYRDCRGLPTEYDTPERNHILLTDAIFSAGGDTPLFPLSFFSSIEAGQTGFVRTGNWLEAQIMDGFIGMNAYAGILWADNFLTQGTTSRKTMEAENGVYAGASFRAGLVETGFSYNLTTTRQSGYAAIGIRPGKTAEGSGQEDDGEIRSIAFQLAPLFAGIQIRRSIAEYPLTVSPVFGAESGPIFDDGLTYLHYRYQQCFFGMELSNGVLPWLDLFAFGAGGAYRLQIQTNEITASVVLSAKNSCMAMAEAGVRLFPFPEGTALHGYGLAVSGRLEYADVREPEADTTLYVYLMGSTGRKRR